jgi:hypothetical protein
MNEENSGLNKPLSLNKWFLRTYVVVGPICGWLIWPWIKNDVAWSVAGALLVFPFIASVVVFSSFVGLKMVFVTKEIKGRQVRAIVAMLAVLIGISCIIYATGDFAKHPFIVAAMLSILALRTYGYMAK